MQRVAFVVIPNVRGNALISMVHVLEITSISRDSSVRAAAVITYF